jgi:hypothetical protein
MKLMKRSETCLKKQIKIWIYDYSWSVWNFHFEFLDGKYEKEIDMRWNNAEIVNITLWHAGNRSLLLEHIWNITEKSHFADWSQYGMKREKKNQNH